MGLHHLHVRKRTSRQLEPFPARTTWRRVLDRSVLAFSVIGPIVSAPQVYQVYSTGDASGLVAFSWGAWAAMNLPWILYGFIHKEAPIMMTHSLWFLINSSMCVAALLYGGAAF